MDDELRKAAQDVIDRWHTPNWAHDSVHTGVLIDALSKALTAHQEQSGWANLTDAECVSALIDAGLNLAYLNYDADLKIARAIESALRAKNTGEQA